MAQTQTIKTIDSKGRVNVGAEFAGKQVILELADSGIQLQYVKAIPVREAWLWENEAALNAVREGIEQAASGELSSGPKDFEASLAFAESLDDPE
ncbi:MAG: hypothetical protein ACSLFI_05580 [Solirubrobacterales bacterium]